MFNARQILFSHHIFFGLILILFSQAHQRLKITKDHTIQPRGSVANDDSAKKVEKKNQGYLYCIIHPHEQLSLFCQTCDRLTCRDCQLTDHRDHKYNFIHEIAVTTRTSVSTLLKEVR